MSTNDPHTTTHTLLIMYQRIIDSFDAYLGNIIAALPNLLSGLLVLLVGWLLAKLLKSVILRTGKRALDPVAERSGLDAVLSKLGGLSLTKLLAWLAYALVLLVFLTAAADTMGMDGLTRAIHSFLAYLPTLLTAMAIFLVGFMLAEKVKSMVSTLTESIGLSGGKSIAKVLFGIVMLFMTITALNVAGVDTTLITSNILIVIGAVLIAFAIAYGFAAREILTNILSSYYGKDRFKPGMRIRMGNDEGVIERIDSISITLRTADKLVLLPTKHLVSERIEVLDEPAE